MMKPDTTGEAMTRMGMPKMVTMTMVGIGTENTF